MVRSARTWRVAVLTPVVLALALGLSGCELKDAPAVAPTPTSTGPTVEQPQVPKLPQSPSTSASGTSGATTSGGKPSGDSTHPTTKPIPDDTAKVATAYLNARENAASYDQPTATSWLKNVEPLMTKKGFEVMKASLGDPSGAQYAWQVSHDKGYAVKVSVNCVANSAVPDTDTSKALLCSLTDQVVDKTGKPVPTTDIPPSWPYVGPQASATLMMAKVGSDWRVDLDASGMAS